LLMWPGEKEVVRFSGSFVRLKSWVTSRVRGYTGYDMLCHTMPVPKRGHLPQISWLGLSGSVENLTKTTCQCDFPMISVTKQGKPAADLQGLILRGGGYSSCHACISATSHWPGGGDGGKCGEVELRSTMDILL